ncbi:MFS transporter [Corynebacterium felinum]|uniref:MFS family permease n=1 Tax=Corynebacterium felinum TaxID=131318 RepID=A0ABU2BBE2_9CORY|nr:MFS transporter [Corynebacterium felinum]MDF5819933.1 MFS transporter [Corynebacterium felinum]MDR7355923.1 MFS family permease [Corynebacterium felinum]WJY95263.1 multidrug resistance protein MdtH [Corynebacterium felinum]
MALSTRVRVENLAQSKLLIASALMNSAGSGLMMAFLLIYFDRTTSVGLATIGVAITAGRTIAALVPAVIGSALNRIGPRKVAMLGDVITGFGYLMCLWVSESVLLIVASQLLAQAGSHMFWTSSRGLVSLASQNKNMQTWFGLIGAIRNAGIGFGTLISSLAFSTKSPEVLHGVIVACAALYFGSTVALQRWKPVGECNTHANDPEVHQKTTLWKVLADGPYLRLLVLNLGLVLAAMVISLVLAIYVSEQLGLPAVLAGFLVVGNTVVVALLSTHVADWTQKFSPHLNITIGYILNLTSFAVFWSAIAVVKVPIATVCVITLVMIIYTAAEMISTPASNVLSVTLAPQTNNGQYMAAFQMTWSVGMTLAPALFGWLLTTGPHATWLALIILTLVCFLASTVKKKEMNNSE